MRTKLLGSEGSPERLFVEEARASARVSRLTVGKGAGSKRSYQTLAARRGDGRGSRNQGSESPKVKPDEPPRACGESPPPRT